MKKSEIFFFDHIAQLLFLVSKKLDQMPLSHCHAILCYVVLLFHGILCCLVKCSVVVLMSSIMLFCPVILCYGQ